MIASRIDRYRPIKFVEAAINQSINMDADLVAAEKFGSKPLFALSSNALNGWLEMNVALPDRLISFQVPRVDGEWDCSSISAQSAADIEDIQMGARGAYVRIDHQKSTDASWDASNLSSSFQIMVDGWHQHLTAQDSLGLGVSKVGGLPCWLQEPLHFADFEFVVQLDEFELVEYDRAFVDIFQGGLGYLFLESLTRVTSRGDEVQRGIFVIQYS